jgi:3-hydroxybutyrate dehydrogenase
MNLKGKVALVTGSTSGIGLGIARALAAEGADIAMNGFGAADAIEAMRSAIASEFGVRVAHFPADMAKPAEIADIVARSVAALGGVDILVNNAGVQHVAPIEAFPDAEWDRVIAINLSAVFHATKAVIPGMRAKGWGRVVNIASAHGLVASGQKVAYVAAKHGVVGMTKVAAIELAGSGATCNAICPGWVLTPLVEQQLQARAAETGQGIDAVKEAFLAEKQPLHEFSTPEQIGAAAVFLCSEGARTITGTSLSVDGGWVIQ